MAKRGRRSSAGHARQTARNVEYAYMRQTARDARDNRSIRFAGVFVDGLSRMSFGKDAAERYVHSVWDEARGDWVDCKLRDTRPGVLVKGKSVGRKVGAAYTETGTDGGLTWRDGGTSADLLGGTTVPDDLRVSVRVWDSETDTRVTVMVPAYLVEIVDPKPVAARALTTEEQYQRNGWSH